MVLARARTYSPAQPHSVIHESAAKGEVSSAVQVEFPISCSLPEVPASARHRPATPSLDTAAPLDPLLTLALANTYSPLRRGSMRHRDRSSHGRRRVLCGPRSSASVALREARASPAKRGSNDQSRGSDVPSREDLSSAAHRGSTCGSRSDGPFHVKLSTPRTLVRPGRKATWPTDLRALTRRSRRPQPSAVAGTTSLLQATEARDRRRPPFLRDQETSSLGAIRSRRITDASPVPRRFHVKPVATLDSTRERSCIARATISTAEWSASHRCAQRVPHDWWRRHATRVSTAPSPSRPIVLGVHGDFFSDAVGDVDQAPGSRPDHCHT